MNFSSIIILLCIYVGSFFAFTRGAIHKTRNLSPVILIPGDGGSPLEAKLNKTETIHFFCEKTTKDYYRIWFNILLLVPYVIDCSIDNMKLVYNNETRKTSNQPGVDVRVPNFGDPFAVEWLDPWKSYFAAYYKDIANTLVPLGYERNVNLHGAPFDFRKGPNELLDFFQNLKNLVEETYTNNGNESVIFIAHSLGGPLSVSFFQMQTQSWKNKYIKYFISLSGAFAGTVRALKVFIEGDNLDMWILNQKVIKQLQITFPSLSWLLPHSDVFLQDDLVETRDKNYTSTNLKEFFHDIDYITAWEMREDQKPYTSFDPPGVEIHCLHGYGFQTIEKLVYQDGKFPDKPDFVYGDGDGYVNKKSLESCTYWAGKQSPKVTHKRFPNVDHQHIVYDNRILNYILQLVKGP